MKKYSCISILLFAFINLSIPVLASDSHDHELNQKEHHDDHEHGSHDDEHEHGHDDHDHDHEENSVDIKKEIADASAITTTIADAGAIDKKITLYGKVNVAPEYQRKIKARFPGVVKEIKVQSGDYVKLGDLLLSVESNEGLSLYKINAPIAGRVVERKINPGELTGTNTLISLVDENHMIVLAHAFSKEALQIKSGQAVVVKNNRQEVVASVDALLPDTHKFSTSLVKVTLDNQQRQWITNESVVLDVSVDKTSVPLVVDNRAIQQMDGQSVVFVKQGNRYEKRPLVLGVSDSQCTQVVEGLNKGDEYVVNNSYVLKADLEKSAASHDH
jgi:membrane fusion protein, heavy metal efflux system